ncbi:hypothetical protein L208DRAFT_1419166, partial [Tricholoma matsutake]
MMTRRLELINVCHTYAEDKTSQPLIARRSDRRVSGTGNSNRSRRNQVSRSRRRRFRTVQQVVQVLKWSHVSGALRV